MSQSPAKSNAVMWMAIAALVVLVSSFIPQGGDFNFVVTLVFWIGIAQGCIAVVAIVDVCLGKWIRPLKPYLLSVYPLMLVAAILSLLLFVKMNSQSAGEVYGWLGTDEGVFFNKTTFLLSVPTLLVISFLIARRFAALSLAESDEKVRWGIFYILAYVTTQSTVAFVWVMSMENPWISTLFGGWFFIEAIQLTWALCAIILFSIYKTRREEFEARKSLRHDVGKMLFGFTVVWAYFTFAQFLVLWYGKIPELVHPIVHRLTHEQVLRIATLSLFGILFAFPFIALLTRASKLRPRWMLFVACWVIAAHLVERWVIFYPNLHFHALDYGIILLQFVAMAAALVVLFKNRPQIELAEPPASH